MAGKSKPQLTSSIPRVLRGLLPEHQAIVTERYMRLLPVLLLLMRPRDIFERNRTWPGVSPTGKGTTRQLSLKPARHARDRIGVYAAQHGEDPDALWRLFRAYCRYGPIGLIEALPSNLAPLIPDELQECADFHRLAKHPRSDAGIYVRELLDEYADQLGYPRLPTFVARYAFAGDQRLERWYVGEHAATDYLTTTKRRLNVDLPYEHRCWSLRIAQLPFQCQIAQRHPIAVYPWLCWVYDTYTETLMGVNLCPGRPTTRDALLCLRWSIWHSGAPWWKARGVPDHLLLPPEYATFPADAQQALRYLRCDVTPHNIAPSEPFPGLPDTFRDWITGLARSTTARAPYRATTLAGMVTRLLDYLHDASTTVAAVSPPATLIERGVSLPWESGIAAVLLLPSAGVQVVRHGKVLPYDVPFDAAECDISDGQRVDVRYDPADARWIYLVSGRAQVRRAPACAFEHQVAWIELVDDPRRLLDVASGNTPMGNEAAPVPTTGPRDATAESAELPVRNGE